jgi:hypothetical protein
MMCARIDNTGLLADVAYSVLRGQADVGHERCRLHRRADGGYWITSDLDLTLPDMKPVHLQMHVAPDWRIESLKVRWLSDPPHDATYQVAGSTWKATIVTPATTIERSLAFGPNTLVDFDSACSAMLAINQLKLAPDEKRRVDTIRIEWPQLEPVPSQKQIERQGTESITTPAGQFETARYRWGTRHVWVDARGIIVATDSSRLVEYHWLG